MSTEKEHVWPSYKDGQRYVVDKIGVVWLLCPEYDGGMATTATSMGQISVGINVLRNERGPLYILDLQQSILDNFSMMHPDCENHDPKTRYEGPVGAGLNRHLNRVTYCGNCGRTIGLG